MKRFNLYHRRFRRIAVVAACTVLAGCALTDTTAPPVQAQAPVAAAPAEKTAPAGGKSVLATDPMAALKVSNDATKGSGETVAVEGQSFSSALRLTTRARTETIYAVQASETTTQPVKKGDVLLATFYARTIQGTPETGEAQTEFVFEKNSDPFTKSVSLGIRIPARGWKRFDIPFQAAENLDAGAAQVCFRMGYGTQAFEVAAFTVVNYEASVAMSALPRTRASYAGEEANAPWRKAALARIEKIRKGDLTVLVRDGKGKPVPGATVAVRMQKHAFKFGSAVAADEILASTPDAQRYRETIVKLFNRVVMENDLKWQGFEENPERAKGGVSWLRDHDIEVRGHNLIWPAWSLMPRDIEGLKGDKAALTKRIHDHITREVGAFKGELVEWDVINEPFANHDVMDVLGRDAMIDWYRWTREADPKAVLFLNDYPPLDGSLKDNPHLDSFFDNLTYLKKNGAPLGGIGFQCHFGGSAIPPVQLLSGLDRFATFGLPIEATEFDINTNDEDFQARYTRDFMTALFSHPSVNGIIMWGFWAGRHWIPDAALYRQDWSLKPNGQAWIDLVQKEWWTKADLNTNAQGTAITRGFLGDYEITVTGKNGAHKTIKTTLVKSGKPLVITLN